MAMIEKTESLEQLRALYNGMTIKIIQTNLNPVGIDTIQDFEKFKNIYATVPVKFNHE